MTNKDYLKTSLQFMLYIRVYTGHQIPREKYQENKDKTNKNTGSVLGRYKQGLVSQSVSQSVS